MTFVLAQVLLALLWVLNGFMFANMRARNILIKELRRVRDTLVPEVDFDTFRKLEAEAGLLNRLYDLFFNTFPFNPLRRKRKQGKAIVAHVKKGEDSNG